MKKGMHLWTVSALLATGGAFAQEQPPAQPAQPEQTQNVEQQEMSKLALRLVALQKLAASAEGGLTQEQAHKLLPYILAVRTSAAVWDSTAEFYAQAMDSVLTPEQRQAVEATPASSEQAAPPAPEGGEGTGESGTEEGTGETGGAEGNQPAPEQTAQTEVPALATDAPNPFAAEPYAELLDQLIQQLQSIVKGEGGNQG